MFLKWLRICIGGGHLVLLFKSNEGGFQGFWYRILNKIGGKKGERMSRVEE